ncbi:hypothetical protein B5F38_00490 [Barnesiella sp. An22]|nr:hypothetical protein B5F38_00490 [Barnesiella sp. An22]
MVSKFLELNLFVLTFSVCNALFPSGRAVEEYRLLFKNTIKGESFGIGPEGSPFNQFEIFRGNISALLFFTVYIHPY